MNSHMFFTVHIYQYRVEKNSKNAGGGKMVCRGFNKSWLLAIYRRLSDFLPPSVWISLMKIKMTLIEKKAKSTTTITKIF